MVKNDFLVVFLTGLLVCRLEKKFFYLMDSSVMNLPCSALMIIIPFKFDMGKK